MKAWPEQEVEILKQNYGKIAIEDLLKLLPTRKLPGIYHKASRLGLKGNFSLSNRTNDVDDYFFSTPNPICSYVAGFIAADGHITKNKCKVCISQKDPEILYKIKTIVDFNGPITHSYTRGDICYNLTVASQQWVNDLDINYNISNNKSLSLRPPIGLDEVNNLSYIVGLIDGDGSIYKFTTKPNHKEYLRLHVINTVWITEWLKEVLGCGFTRKNMNNYKPETGTYDCVCNQALEVINRLRSIDDLQDIRMNRKWDKILELNNA